MKRIVTVGLASGTFVISILISLCAAFSAAPAGETILRQFAGEASLSDLRWPRFRDYRAQVVSLYDSTGYTPIWIQGGKVTIQARQLIEILQNADAKGLDPEDYDSSRWTARLNRFQSASAWPSENEAARFDLALTVSAMRYISDLNVGRVNPKLCHFGFDVKDRKLDLAEFLRERVMTSGSVREALDAVEPPFPGYQRLERALRTYLALAREDDGKLLLAPRKSIEPGESFQGCARLARLLQRIGDLPMDVTPAPACPLYGGSLVDAVKRFQRRHGLDPDGRIGKATLEQLNTPLSRRVRQLQLTLERWHWAPHHFSAPPIVVNIPEFRLRSYDGSYRNQLEMNVVVGSAYKRQTPVFVSEMRYLIFRPYWNVPRSIERAEITPEIERDRSYASKNGYEITDVRGQVIPGDVVSDQTLRKLRSGQMLVRQVPGSKNALGLVKFVFPNEYNIYMHDTPAVHLFSKPRRDFSHGCIRVQAPEELAVWVLKNNPEWNRARIREAMHGDKTIQVNLKNPIPVLIVYGTAVASETGEVSFRTDIYGHDASLETFLAKGRPYSD